ncbi:MAG: hypothetical protein JWQ26_114 [Modestobacter sp.]|jgi:hypothetical protein|nr:hypothetical protein [Modestobacter sp.]
MPDAEEADERRARAQRLREEMARIRRRQSGDEAGPPTPRSPREFTDDAASRAAESGDEPMDTTEGAPPDDEG